MGILEREAEYAAQAAQIIENLQEGHDRYLDRADRARSKGDDIQAKLLADQAREFARQIEERQLAQAACDPRRAPALGAKRAEESQSVRDAYAELDAQLSAPQAPIVDDGPFYPLVAMLREVEETQETEISVSETSEATDARLCVAVDEIERGDGAAKPYAASPAVTFTGQPAFTRKKSFAELLKLLRQRPSEVDSALRSEVFGWQHYARPDPVFFTPEEIEVIRKERKRIQNSDYIWRKRREKDGWTLEQIKEGMKARRAARTIF